MKKINWKRGVVAAVTAGLMLVSVPGVAMAAEVTSKDTAITKTWTAASDAQLNNTETFKFHLQYAGYTAQGTTGGASDAIMKISKDVTLDSQWLDNATDSSSTATMDYATLLDDIDFDKPGVYTFTLTEAAGTNANIDYDHAQYTVVVNVEWALGQDGAPTDQTQIQSVGVQNSTGDKVSDGRGASFNNTAAANSHVSLTKKVAGTAADTHQDFTFTIQLSNVTGEYVINMPEGENDILTNGGQATVTLHHGETATIENLPVGATYTITETDTDYTETNMVNETPSANGLVATGTVDDTNDTVVFTNEKGFAPETGITMNTLPFVGVGVVAAAGAVTLVISRKRRAGEDF